MKNLNPLLVLFTFCRLVFNSAFRMIYAFLPIFGRSFGVDLHSMSLAITARSAVSSLGPFAASISDLRSRKAGMLLGMGLFSAGSALVVFFPTFPFFVASIIISTIGKYVFDPGMQAYLGDRIHYEQRGRLLAITEFGWSLAFVLGVPLAGYLIAINGWMSPFKLFALLGLVSFLLLYFSIPDNGVTKHGTKTMLGNFGSVFRYPPALLMLGVALFASTSNEMINLIFGVWLDDSLKNWVGLQGFDGILHFLNFFKDSLGLDIALLILAAIVIGLSELLAEGLVSRFVDRIGKPRAVALGMITNSFTALLLPVVGKTTLGALFGLFLFFISFEFTLVSLITLVTEIMPHTRATLMAFNVGAISIGRAIGDLISPYFYVNGLLISAIGAVIFNIAALLFLWRYHVHEHIIQS
ncbi:MFS transporter [Chloroflexota bacterium]